MNRLEKRSFPQLDHIDLQLIAIAKAFPAESFSAWSNHLHVSPNTVARHYDRLNRHGILRIIGRTLPTFDGHMSWLVRIQSPSPYLRTLATDFTTLDYTRWVRLSIDGRELICGLVTSNYGVDQLLIQAHKKLPEAKITAHYLLKVWGQPGAVRTAPTQLDALDKVLLAQLGLDGRVSNVSLSRRLGVDPTTISRRRKRLEDGNILYYEADIDTRVYGDGDDANLWITMQPGKIDALGTYLKSRPEVNFVAATSGASQIAVHLALHSVQTSHPFTLPQTAEATTVAKKRLGEVKDSHAGKAIERETPMGAASLLEFVDGLAGWDIEHVEVVPMGATMKRHQR